MAQSKSVVDVVTDFLVDNKTGQFQTWGHALYIISTNKKQGLPVESYWLHSLVWAVLRTTGGGIIRSVLLQEKPPVLADKIYLPIIIASWYLSYYVTPFSNAQNTTGGKALLGAVEAISKLQTITGGVDKAVQVLPDSPIAAVLVGVLSGCGGTLLYDFEKLARGETTNYTAPSWVLKVTFWSALLYYLATHYAGILSPRRAKLILGLFLIAHYLVRAIINPNWNAFKAVGLEEFFYRVTRIPKPKAK